ISRRTRGSCISEGPGASTWVCPDCSRCAFIYSPSRKWNGQSAGWRPHDRFLKTITNSPGSILSIHSMKRSEEHTSELQSLMRISYDVFCLKKKKKSLHT